MEILNPIDFKRIRDKVPLQYSKEFMDSLLTIEKAEEMVKNGEQGIAIETPEEGVKIVKLTGANFRLFMHTTGLNNSSLGLPRGMDITEIWKYFENGTSTISGSPIEGDMLKGCLNSRGYNLGLCSVDPRLIIGMGPLDIHTSHMVRELNPGFDYGRVSYEYPDELLRRTAAQIKNIEGESKDPTHEYSEVATKRRHQDINRGSHTYRDRRVMPDCIIVYGAGKTDASIIALAKKFGKDGKPLPIFEIDINAYGDRLYQRAHQKEDHSGERKESDTIKQIKDIIESKEKE